jgi:hypothetical protein
MNASLARSLGLQNAATALAAIGLVALSLLGVAAQDHAGQSAAAKAAQRAREGSLLTDETGSFEFVGDRVIFVSASGRESLRVLENLALERIVRELGDARDQRNWTVNGVLTEFKGANYLLVTKAMLAIPAGAAPAPNRPGTAATPPSGPR